MHVRTDFPRPDFYDRNSRLNLLPKVLCGPLRRIIIGDYTDINGAEHAVFPRRVPLIVQVQEFDTPDSNVINTSLIRSVGTKSSTILFYAIERSTLPTAMQLDEWGRNSLLEFSEIPHFRPYIMDSFLFSYLKVKPDLRYVSFPSP